MARIAGVDLQDNWNLDYALTNIKGIGWSRSKMILEDLKLDAKKKVSELSPEEISQIASAFEDFAIEGDLARQIKGNITRLKQVSAYRGVRHSRGLPVRGQRTRTNARTKRGKRRTVGAFKKDALVKMQAQK